MICMWHFGPFLLYAVLAMYAIVFVGIPAVILSTVLSVRAMPASSEPDLVVAKGLQGSAIGAVTPQGGMFWGVPFSQPPKGEFRWMKPRQPVPFPGGVWNATYHRPGCPQLCNYKSKNFTCPDQTDEDCLYLNIWVPRTVLSGSDGDNTTEKPHYVISGGKAGDKGLAVMVYLHGGNFMFGAGSARIYDGRFLAEQGDVIVVSTNFRLGVFGFLVQGDGPDGALGNFGIWDQLSALKWVQENIAFYGGDPDKVTLFGQSSGAESVAVLMTSSHSKGLFQRAILSSNPLSLPLRDVNGAREFGAKFAMELHCEPGNLSCLRDAHVDDVLRAAKAGTPSIFGPGKKLYAIQPWGPIVDGDVLMETPLDAFSKGHAMQIPFIMGVTTDEGMYFVPLVISYKLSTIFYQFAISSLMGENSAAVLRQYPTNCQSNCDNRYMVSDIVTDYMFTCPSRAALLGQSSGNPQSWFYIFDQILPFTNLWESPMCKDKVCHSADLPFVFDTVELAELRFSEDEKILAKRIGFYWTNFAKYGNPNGDGEFLNNSQLKEHRTQGEFNAPFWPRFSDPDYGQYSAIKLKSSGDIVVSDPYQDVCNFWDKLNSYGAFR